MSNAVISLMFAAGVSAWAWSKFMNYSGNNSRSAAIATAVTGVISFIFALLLTNMLF